MLVLLALPHSQSSLSPQADGLKDAAAAVGDVWRRP